MSTDTRKRENVFMVVNDDIAFKWPAGLTLVLPPRNARWIEPARPAVLQLIGADSSYIAPPDPANRHDWVEALHAYRSAVRSAALQRTRIAELTLERDAVWATIDDPIARALRVGDLGACTLELHIRNTSGHDQRLALRWELTGPAVIEPVPVSASAEWQVLHIPLHAPPHGRNLRMGLDPEAGSQPGAIEISHLALYAADEKPSMRVREALERRLTVLRDYSVYDRRACRWLATAFTCHFTFMYDTAFYHPDTGYRLDAFLDDGGREFGGYDAILLWHAYPRLGLDERNQIDFYRDMPGGLDQLRTLVSHAHERQVRVFINYNPWDTGTRPESTSSETFLAQLVEAIDADGIFLDTLANVPHALPEAIEAARPGTVMCPEINPPLDMLPMAAASWAQWSFNPGDAPGLEHRKWIEPRHMRWQIRRWDRRHLGEIQRAFFNGSGMMVWENVFGAYNPWREEDRVAWRRAVAILRAFSDLFTSTRWEPLVPVTAEEHAGVVAHRWPGGTADLYTVLRTTQDMLNNELELSIEDGPDTRFFDLWRADAAPLNAWRDRGTWHVPVTPDPYAGLTAILAVHAHEIPESLKRYLAEPALARGSALTSRAFRTVTSIPARAPSVTGAVPAGMCHVPGASFQFRVEHMRRECGCYPDPDATAEHAAHHLWGDPFQETLVHDFPVTIAPFLIDEATVTNAQYAAFLHASGYRPNHAHKFLAHWRNGACPKHLAGHPVVYVDIDDARAYAQWAGKRLPTEYEWHRAAQGEDGRKWPWGNAYRGDCVNLTGATMPARSLDAGRSPCGCYHMSGNVYELTESLRTDGHTRYLMLRGGSYFRAEGSIWYMDNGPQPNDHHAKCILMWPGIDRCATVGFRCVYDIE